ncbi:MAG: LD-carboxypeptidase [Myxococcota bacterium]|nr:LD-carboxypeptidase [Myxococcota bacterium]
MLVPPTLCDGDKIAVVAPAGPVDEESLEKGIGLLSQRFEVVRGSALLRRAGFLAGTDDERLGDLAQALADPSIKGVIAARGGYGTTRLLDRLERLGLPACPKWIVGCSDVTAHLMTAFCRLGMATIHGPMVAGLWRTESADVEELFGLLGGVSDRPDQELSPVFPGSVRGPLLGGNLTVLAHLVGTLDKERLRGAILLLEDVGEAPYRLDRCFVQLRRAGWLEQIGGVVIGELGSGEPDKYGVSAIEALRLQLRDLQTPSASGYPAAHGARNRPFVHGAEVTLEVDSRAARLAFFSLVR